MNSQTVIIPCPFFNSETYINFLGKDVQEIISFIPQALAVPQIVLLVMLMQGS